ncbi:MAG: MBL fold metallo-hydrolase [Pseudomonadota bacterium]
MAAGKSALIAIGLTTSLLAACGSTESDPAPHTPAPSIADGTTANWQPLPANVAISHDTQLARQRILGIDKLDAGQVKLWWYGVSSFIMAAGGHLFLLDAWEVVGVHKGYTPISRDDLVALKPEAIFIGHGHFDHAADAGYIASRTGAALIAGDSVCDQARTDAASNADALNFRCLRLGLDGDNPAGTVFPTRIFTDMADVQIIKHTHSAADPASLTTGGMPLVYTPEILPFLTNLNTDPSETLKFLQSLPNDGGAGQPEGGTWAYHFRVGNFSLLWNDSSGSMPEGDKTADAVRAALAHLPDCVDVHLGAIVGFGMVTSSYRDALAYVAAAQPKLFMPNHHDAWAPVIGGGASAYETQWTQALMSLPNPPKQDYLRDPEDYLKVRSFDVRSPEWASNCR